MIMPMMSWVQNILCYGIHITHMVDHVKVNQNGVGTIYFARPSLDLDMNLLMRMTNGQVLGIKGHGIFRI